MFWIGGCIAFVIGDALDVGMVGRFPGRIGIFGGLGIMFLPKFGGGKGATCCR